MIRRRSPVSEVVGHCDVRQQKVALQKGLDTRNMRRISLVQIFLQGFGFGIVSQKFDFRSAQNKVLERGPVFYEKASIILW